ncbi:unnamed protein product [Macrosiphum euphorbiae]|uniref:Uncharacterized protein n=1 Tax=Macrosiphum euphorbiae TaxID=13131 RepID=A0AAV0WLA6_9HEMI|nr:unnamed protein product [Macrosiphum euphorbiae]
MLLPLLTKYINYIDFSNTLKLGINIDGIPITKSSKSQLWPILISVINCSQISNIVLSIGNKAIVTTLCHTLSID